MPAINTAKEVVKDVDASIKVAKQHMKINCLWKDEPTDGARGKPKGKAKRKAKREAKAE